MATQALDEKKNERAVILMPYWLHKKKGGKYSVHSPHGTKAKGTTLHKAKRQKRLLQAIKHGWRPTGRR
jgi:hypothetical protein